MEGNGNPPVEANGDPRVGVYVCHCGFNIAATVDVDAVRDAAESFPNVAVARDYEFMCSNAGQDLILYRRFDFVGEQMLMN